ncbi:MAG: DUF2336 domain-containing protein [Xanthobacteraceae bacterium]|nr:MAG: DUF2336 domain-containing protein [Xanthobacteraceae bacterium]
MIVRHFLSWVRTASAGERAEATHALARAWLISDLSDDDRAAAEGALLMLLDDASPLVRQAMAEVFAASADAPPAIVHALAADQPSVALPVIEFSPLLIDTDLVDLVATAATDLQCAVARRHLLPVAVAAAVAEVAGPEACLELLENPGAELAEFSLRRIVERHGHLAAIREALIVRDDLPAPVRLVLMERTADVLTRFVVACNWLSSERAERAAADARSRSLMTIAAVAVRGTDIAGLVHHLHEAGQLTPALVLRALLSGNMAMFEQALIELTGLPPERVGAMVMERGGTSLKALMTRAGFPEGTILAFRAALSALHEIGFAGTVGGVTRLRRTMVERVLTACEDAPAADAEPLLILLRRFATEAAREEARLYCDELVAEENPVPEACGQLAA